MNLKASKIGSFFLDLIETLVISLSIFLVVYLFFMQPHQVNGQSMVPNFQNGEHVLTDKISYKLGDPQRGDVIVFYAPDEAHCPKGTGCDYIKRIIALPGEKIEIKNSAIYVDSQLLKEEYLPSNFKTNSNRATLNGPIVLGPNEYFAVGDNRAHSSDSRTWGPIKLDDVVGRAFFRYWPVNVIGVIKKITY
jgi:signal peptidase I